MAIKERCLTKRFSSLLLSSTDFIIIEDFGYQNHRKSWIVLTSLITLFAGFAIKVCEEGYEVPVGYFLREISRATSSSLIEEQISL